jgi:hypothetical protein
MIISKTYQKRNSVLFSSNIIFLQMCFSTKAKRLVISTIGFISPAYADWFQVDNIKANLILPMYKLVNENLVFLALTVGKAATFLARGQDMYLKDIAFGVGSLGATGEVRLVETSKLLMEQQKAIKT